MLRKVDATVLRALEDCETLNTSSQWAVLKVTEHSVVLSYGAIWPNGERERAIAERVYTGRAYVTHCRG